MNPELRESSGGTSTVLVGSDLAYKNVRDRETLLRERAILVQLLGMRGTPEIIVDRNPHCITMSRVPGAPLSFILAHENLPKPISTQIMLSLASVLAVLHLTHGILHNDICQDNTFYDQKTRQGHFIDFGSACFINSQANDNLRTQGKLEYFSPEKIDPSIPFGLPSDIFSLGVLFYQISEGCFPFPLEVGGIKQQILSDTPLFADGHSPAVGNLIMSMLEKHPTNRPTALEVKKILEGK